MKKITLFFVALFITTVTFGQMSGTYKVGTSEVSPNFTTLKAACDAINTAGVSGNIVLEVTSDLTEAANVGLGVNTNGYSITIRPDQDADRTITFTQLADNSSPTGHFVIGYVGAGLPSSWSDANTIATNNVTIDGYAVGSSTRRLTFKNTNANHVGARMIVVVGACENIIVKNSIINNLTTSTTSPFCIGAVVRKKIDLTEVAPKNFTVENNSMQALGNGVAMGMRVTNSYPTGTTFGGNVKLTGLVIKNNLIIARRRLIELNYVDGGDIYNNELKTQQTGVAGTISYGIWTSTGVTGTINIYNNKFTQAFTEETGAFGHRVISLASTASYNVYNNMFAGLDKTKAASSVALNLTYLFYSGVAGKIYNNTFYMQALTDPSSTGYYNAIQLSGNTAEIKNNIFISDEPTHSNTAFISAVPTPASDYNDFYLRQSHTGSKIVSTYTTIGDYQTANPTKDINSKSKAVNFVSTTDLSLTGTSIDDVDITVPAIGTPVSTDIFGNARHTPKVYMGAHEPNNINDTQTFTVTAPQGTEHVYIVGSFIGKAWDIATPYELTATANANEFSGTFPAHSDVAYKYLCQTGNWDYQEATSVSPLTAADNHAYAANDVVAYWKAMPKIKLNVSIASSGGVPSKLYVKGSWDTWATPVELTASSTPLSISGQKVKSATNTVSYTGTIGNGTTDLIYANTEYKYYTTDLTDPNWEVNADGSGRDNRWSIYPLMNDEIARFATQIATAIGTVKDINVVIMRTPSGIVATFDGNVIVELYSINGSLIEKTKASGSYSRDLEHGAYIIRINGKSTKFVK